MEVFVKTFNLFKSSLICGILSISLTAGSAFDTAAFKVNAVAMGDLLSMSTNDVDAFVSSVKSAIDLISTDKVTANDFSCGDLQAGLLLATGSSVSDALKAKRDILNGYLNAVQTFISSGGKTLPSVSGSSSSTSAVSTSAASGAYQDPVKFLKQQFDLIKSKRSIYKDVSLADLTKIVTDIQTVLTTSAPIVVSSAEIASLTASLKDINDKMMRLNSDFDKDGVTRISPSKLKLVLPESLVAPMKNLSDKLASLSSQSPDAIQNRLDAMDKIYSKPDEVGGDVFAAATGGEKRFLDLVNFMMSNLSSLSADNLQVFSWIVEEGADREDYSKSTKDFLTSLLPNLNSANSSSNNSSSTSSSSTTTTTTQDPTWVGTEASRLSSALGTLVTDGKKQFLDDFEKLAKVYRQLVGAGTITNSNSYSTTMDTVNRLKSDVKGNYRFAKSPDKERVADIANRIDGNLSVNQKMDDYAILIDKVNNDAGARALFNSFKNDIVDSNNVLLAPIKALSDNDKATILKPILDQMRSNQFFGAVSDDLNTLSERITDGATFGERVAMLNEKVTGSSDYSKTQVSDLLKDLAKICQDYDKVRANGQDKPEYRSALIALLQATQNADKKSSIWFRRVSENSTQVNQLLAGVQAPLSVDKLVNVLKSNLDRMDKANSVSEADLANQVKNAEDLTNRIQLAIILGTAKSTDVSSMQSLLDRMKGMDLFSVDKNTLDGFKTVLATSLSQTDKYAKLMTFCTNVSMATSPTSDDCANFLRAVNGVLYPALSSLTSDQVDSLKNAVDKARANTTAFSAAQVTDLKSFSDNIDKFKSSKTVTQVQAASVVPVINPSPAVLTPATSNTTSQTTTSTTGGTVVATSTSQPLQVAAQGDSLGRAVSAEQSGGSTQAANTSPAVSSGVTRRRAGVGQR